MSYSSKLSLNVILHVTILFTILYLLFKLYISKIISTLINNELGHLVENSLESVLYDSNKVPKQITVSVENLGIKSDNISKILTSMIDENPVIKNLKDNNVILNDQYKNTTDDNAKQKLKIEIDKTNSLINEKIKIMIKSKDLKFFMNTFKPEDSSRKYFNDNLFQNIEIINIILVIFLVFFVFISVINKNLTMSEVIHIFIENIITFILVGLIEVWFFLNVASKFIPAPPSIIFTSLFESLKDLFVGLK